MKKKLLWPVCLASLMLTGCQAGGVTLKMADSFNRFIGNKTDFQNRELALNVKLAEEGFVLLKNKNNTLPFGSDVQKISILILIIK